MTTIAVVTSCTGEAYHQWLVPWARHVELLTTRPHEIVIATDAPADVREQVDEILPVLWVDPVTVPRVHAACVVNDAIAWTRSEWICKIDVDDIIYPRAYEPLPGLDADVWMVGYYHAGTEHYAPRGITAQQVLERFDNPIGSCSPFRRWLWERQPIRDMLYDDWAFWIDAARAGARFAASPTIDYEYRLHPGMATARLDHRVARDQIQELR